MARASTLAVQVAGANPRARAELVQLEPHRLMRTVQYSRRTSAKLNFPQKNRKHVARGDIDHVYDASLFAALPYATVHVPRRAHNEARTNSALLQNVNFSRPRASGSKTTPQTLQKQTKALNQPWTRSAAASMPSATPQAKDAPTDTLRPRNILSAERRPLDSLGHPEIPQALNSSGKFWAAANQCVWPVEPAQNWAGQSTHVALFPTNRLLSRFVWWVGR